MISKSRMTARNLTLVVAALSFSAAGMSSLAYADEGGQDFVDKKYSIEGAWTVVEEGGQTVIRFADDFKTRGGPDLKVFLSPKAIKDVTGKTATDGSVLLGVLQSVSGTQDYVLPEGIKLDDFSSVLIHCEQYSVLWGGGQL